VAVFEVEEQLKTNIDITDTTVIVNDN